jgi:hypothetical protein
MIRPPMLKPSLLSDHHASFWSNSKFRSSKAKKQGQVQQLVSKSAPIRASRRIAERREQQTKQENPLVSKAALKKNSGVRPSSRKKATKEYKPTPVRRRAAPKPSRTQSRPLVREALQELEKSSK